MFNSLPNFLVNCEQYISEEGQHNDKQIQQIQFVESDEQETNKINIQAIQTHLHNIQNVQERLQMKDRIIIPQKSKQNKNNQQALKKLIRGPNLKYYQKIEQKSFYTKKYHSIMESISKKFEMTLEKAQQTNKQLEKMAEQKLDYIINQVTQGNLRCQPVTFRKVIRNKQFAAFHVTNEYLENNVMSNNCRYDTIDQQCLYGLTGNLVILEHIEPFSMSVSIPGCGIQATYRSLYTVDKLDQVFTSGYDDVKTNTENTQNSEVQTQYQQSEQFGDRMDQIRFPKLNENCYVENTFYNNILNRVVWQANFAFSNNMKTLAFLESPIGFQQFVSYKQTGRYLLVRNRKYKIHGQKGKNVFQEIQTTGQQKQKYEQVVLQKSEWTLRKIQCVFVCGQTILKAEPRQSDQETYNYYNIILQINKLATSNYISNLMYHYNIYEGFYRTLKLNNELSLKPYCCWMQLDRLHGFVHSIYSFYTDVFISQQRELFYPEVQEDKDQYADKFFLSSTQIQSRYVSDLYILAFSQKPQDKQLQQIYEELHDPYKKLICSRYTVNDSVKSQNKDSQETLFGSSFDVKSKIDKNTVKYDLPGMQMGYKLNNILDYNIEMTDERCKEQLYKLGIDTQKIRNSINMYNLEYNPDQIQKTAQKDENGDRLIGYYIYDQQSISRCRELDKTGKVVQLLNFFANFKKKDETVNTALAYQCIGQHTIKQIINMTNYLYQINTDDIRIFKDQSNIYQDIYGTSFQYFKCWFNNYEEVKKQTRSDHYNTVDLEQCRQNNYIQRDEKMQEWTEQQIDRIKEQQDLIKPKDEGDNADPKNPIYYKFYKIIPLQDQNGEYTNETEIQQLSTFKFTSAIFQKAFGGKGKNGILQKLDTIIQNLFGDSVWKYHLDNIYVDSEGNYNKQIQNVFQDVQQEIQIDYKKEKITNQIIQYINGCTYDNLTITIPINTEKFMVTVPIQNASGQDSNKQASQQVLKYIALQTYSLDQILDSIQYKSCEKYLEQCCKNSMLQECKTTELIQFINGFCNLNVNWFNLSIRHDKTMRDKYKYQNLVLMKDLPRPTERRCEINEIIKFFEETYNMISCVLANFLRQYNILTTAQLRSLYKPNQEEVYNTINKTFNKATAFGQSVQMLDYIKDFLNKNQQYLICIFQKLFKQQMRDLETSNESKNKASMLEANTLIRILLDLFDGDIVHTSLQRNPEGYQKFTPINIIQISKDLESQQQIDQDDLTQSQDYSQI